MRIIVTRHGETEANRKGVLVGHGQAELSELGKKQARQLAERLKDEKIDLIISSDLSRAIDTAKEVSKFHPEVDFIFDKRLREGDLGDFEGKKMCEVDWSSRPDNSEAPSNMKKRIYDFFMELIKMHPGKNILLVGHSGINKALIGGIRGYGGENFFEKIRQKNTCVNVFDIGEDGDVEEVLVNCVEHLE